jgi:ABC-type transport system involved in multi-copper enzyme maturation permease subunit
MGQFASQLLPCLLLAAVQFLASVPWLWAMDPTAFRKLARRPATWGNLIGALAGIAVLGAFLMTYQRGSNLLELLGRFYGSILHLQLIVDLFVAIFALLLALWPKGGAVALAAFREGLRQPMFWLIGFVSIVIFLFAIVTPFFTFGDDYKMMKQICFDVTMLAALLFGVLAASISINEEIEGKTAVTLMSKPVTRRQFLVGKYLGIMFASLALTLVLGWSINWALHVQPNLNPLDDVIDPMPHQAELIMQPIFMKVTSGESLQFMKGFGLWTSDALANGLGTLLGFGKVMVMLAIAATLATRMPMITNLVLCMGVYFLGHLAPVLRRVSEDLKSHNTENTALSLVNFLTQLLETVTPSLEYFDMGPAIIRDTPISVAAFGQYVASVSAYALLYTAIALLFGLILFEDRDLA